MFAALRFPKPDFVETGHQIPQEVYPPGQWWGWTWIDLGVLFWALLLGIYWVHYRRSRWGILGLTLVMLLYSGFYRKGCICPIGAIQNVVLAIVSSSYTLPITVLGIFLLPLLVALFYGRIFCSGICPLGGLQELLFIRALGISVPSWLDRILKVGPYIYLSIAVIVTINAEKFLICLYDPFVPVFRLAGFPSMLGYIISFLLLSIIVGRPYCRYLCPYGALLKLMATVSWKPVRITAKECIQCRLCENSCPVQAIEYPIAQPKNSAIFQRIRYKTTLFLILFPLWVLFGGVLGWWIGQKLSSSHPDWAILEHSLGSSKFLKLLPEDQVRKEYIFSKRTREQLRDEHATIQRQFARAGMLAGISLTLIAILMGLRHQRRQILIQTYEADPGDCVACTRCYEYCPQEVYIPGANHTPSTLDDKDNSYGSS